MSESLSSGSMGLKEAKAALDDIESALNMASGGVLDFSEDFANMQTTANNAQLAGQIDAFVEKLKDANIPAADLEKILTKLGQGQHVKDLSSGFKDLSSKIEKAKDASKDLENSTKRLK
jgi:uncharacterized phage infection (PIP) family protein YhgE